MAQKLDIDLSHDFEKIGLIDTGDFWECSFLRDFESECKKHKHVTSKNTKVILKTCEQLYQKQIDLLNSMNWDRRVPKLKCTIQKTTQEKDVTLSKIESQNDLLSEERETCNLLSQQIGEMQNEAYTLSQELELRKDEEVNLIIDINGKLKNFKKKMNAIKTAKMEYKTYLDCHISLQDTNDNGDTYVFTFSRSIRPSSSDSLPVSSIKLLQNNITGKKSWKLLESSPPVSNFLQLSQKLEDTNDVRGLLVHFRTIWLGKESNFINN